MKHIFFLILFILLVQSCSNQDYDIENIPIIIDMDSVKSKSLKFSHIKYIPLETLEGCLIGSANKVLIKDNKIYVADFTNAMALFVFDIHGNFIFKISRMGQGPGEYISFDDFDIQINGDIYIFDMLSKKFLIFNSEGKFQKNIDVDCYFLSFCVVDNKMYWAKLYESGKMFSNLAIYNMTDKNVKLLLNDKKKLHDLGLMNFSSYYFYYSPESNIYYSPKFSEIIYSLDEDGIHPAIGIKNLNIPTLSKINEWMQEKDIIMRSNRIIEDNKYFIENAHIYETDNYITIGCFTGVISKILLYNKHSKSVCYAYSSDFYGIIGIDKVKGSTGKNFFGVIDVNPDNECHKQILKTREELTNWKEDDNPVIVFFNPDM